MNRAVAQDSYWLECTGISPAGDITLQMRRTGPGGVGDRTFTIPVQDADHAFWWRLIVDRKRLPGMFSDDLLASHRDGFRRAL